MEQRTEEWFAARKGRVTASMAGAILGVAPYMTPEQALRSMVRELHGAESEFVSNPAIEWGNANEETAVGMFSVASGLAVYKCGFYPFEDWLGASPDGLIGSDSLLENKCPYGIRKAGNFKSLREQPHYHAQVQIQLLCTGRSKGYFNQWTPWGECYEEVGIDQNWLDTALPKLKEFWEEVHSCNPTEHLEPLRVDLTKHIMLVNEYDELREAKDNADARMKEIIEKLASESKGKNAFIGSRKLTKVSKDGNISYARAVKALLPNADLEPYRGKPSEYWRLT